MAQLNCAFSNKTWWGIKMRNKRKYNNSSNQVLKNEVISLLIISIGILMLISLQTNSTGQLGTFVRNLLYGLFSKPANLLPYLVILVGIMNILGKSKIIDMKGRASILGMYIGYLILFSISYQESFPKEVFTSEGLKLLFVQGVEKSGGGIVGSILGLLSLKYLGLNGSYVTAVTIILVCFIVLTKISIIKMLSTIHTKIRLILSRALKGLKKNKGLGKCKNKNLFSEKETNINVVQPKEIEDGISEQIGEKIKILDFTREEAEPVKINEELGDKDKGYIKSSSKIQPQKDVEEPIELHINTIKTVNQTYKLPTPDLLDLGVGINTKKDKKDILNKAKILEETLRNFGVEAKVMQISKGPTITRYELQPSPGVKVSKIVGLSDDIALNLAATNIRIEAPIPGKAAVGIEIPNDNISTVTIREVIQSDKYLESGSKLTYVLGKDIAGNPITADLSKMPHLLIAGATGSGKSVCINTLITSILFKANPSEVKLLLIDPKVVELNNYNGIPHLLIPVVTDPKKASAALNWAIQEMTGRYKLFASNNVRDINSYNEKMLKNQMEELPKIVIIIDELADLMMVAPGQVEDAICRLAQMARAAGMHLIVATQRPSVDVITGVIKANIPSRIAFAVSSQVDSRTILDMAGAEKLLGKGDMLFYPVGASKPKRVQGAFISDVEVEKIVNYIKEQSIETTYENEIAEELEKDYKEVDSSVDELLEDAIELVVQTGQASVSMLQRRFRVGYNRAARLMDAMEERSIVGAHEGSKPRQVLLSKEELEEMKSRT